MREITVNRKDKALTKMELRHRYVPWKLLRFLTVIFNGVFQKFISTDRQIFNISNKVTSMIIYRSSHRRCSVGKGFLRNCAKVTGKYLKQSLYFNKVGSATLLKSRLPHRCFPMNFAKFLRNTSGRLLLNIRKYFMHSTWRVRSFLEYKIRKVSGFFCKQNRKLL